MPRMYSLGGKSMSRLITCAKPLVLIGERAIVHTPIDFTIIRGWSDNATQDLYYESGASTKRGGESKHNHTEGGKPDSLAFDFGPWVNGRVPWEDTHAFAIIAGAIMSAAHELGFRLRYGGDWDMDGTTTDQKLMDWGHVELWRN